MARFITLAALAALSLVSCHRQGGYIMQPESDRRAVGAIERLQIGPLPCKTRGFACDQEAIYVADKCGNISRLDPVSGSRQIAIPASDLGPTSEIAVDDRHLAVLAKDRQTIRILTKDGQPVSTFNHQGDTGLSSVALWGDKVAAATFYDETLVYIYSLDGSLLQRLIDNASFQPDFSPRTPSFTSLGIAGGSLLLFDLFDFKLYIIDEDFAVTEIQKETHPQYVSHVPPTPEPVTGETRAIMFSGTQFGLSIAADGDTFLALMVSRDGSGAKEIAFNQLDEEPWSGGISLAGSDAILGTSICTIGSTVYILERKANHVYLAPLP
jgi:hypothetical protein